MMTKQEQDARTRRPGDPQRNHTDDSLRVERDAADDRDAEKGAAADATADEVTRLARQRADEVVQSARDDALREGRPPSTATTASPDGEHRRADVVLGHERSTADTVLELERADRRRKLANVLTVERKATDADLTGERAGVDGMIVDLREANEQMVRATLRAQELTVEADAAKELAEKSELDLRAVAEFREMFIAILGHDLRTPLGTIAMASANLLRRGRLDEHDAATASRIIRASQRMTRMVTQLLDLTRARLGGGYQSSRSPPIWGRSVATSSRSSIRPSRWSWKAT